VAKVMTEKPASIRRIRERVPQQVEDAVLTALEKLPADRFGSAAEFAQAITGAPTGRPVSEESVPARCPRAGPFDVPDFMRLRPRFSCSP
jgi:serine/threonine-protein kinase